MDDEERSWHGYLEKAYQVLRTAGRPLAAEELAAAGVNRTTMSQLILSGFVERPVRGVYHVPSSDDDQRVMWASISLGYDAVFCFMSAASFHGLTEEGAGIPDVAIPELGRVPSRYSFESRVRFHRWPLAAMTDDVDTVDIQGVPVRITSPARTVVDMYRHSTLNREPGIKPVVLDTAFIDCISRFTAEGDQNAKTMELRRVADAHGCWEGISGIMSVITATKDRMMTI
jgi:predicted transcriptional regulator of viral defense system